MAGSLTPQIATADKVVTNALQLSGVVSNHILRELTEDSDKQGLLTFEAVAPHLEHINQVLKDLDPNSTYYQDLTVISQSITEPYFTDTNDWVLTNWAIADEKMRYAGGVVDNSLVINNALYPAVGNYYLLIKVTALPSGQLELYKNDEWIGTISAAGAYYKEFTIEKTATDTIRLVAVGVSAGEEVVLDSYGVYFIADRFYNYVFNLVKRLATVDATGFVTVENFNHTLEIFTQQFQQATNMYLEQLRKHEQAKNPHNITPAMIGAAPADHKHDEYLTKTSVGDILEDKLANYALKDHKHTEYVTVNDVQGIVNSQVTDRITELVTVDPVIITAAPTGILPSRYAQTDISLPLTILQPTTVLHDAVTSYDWYYGTVTTNREELMTRAPAVFASEGYAEIDATLSLDPVPINFRICYHHNHRVLGYRIHTQSRQPLEWSVYSGNTTFLHHISDPTNWVTTADGYTCELFFDNEITTESLSFMFERLDESTATTWGLRIEILYNDFAATSFGITNEAFKFCIPQEGTNRVVEVNAALTPRIITPEVAVPDQPLFVFARKNLDDAEVNFLTSYIPPEYATVCKGIDIFVDKDQQFVQDEAVSDEIWVHPAYGTLSLIQGHSAADKSLLQVYRRGDDSWMSDGQNDQIVIEQTFNSDNVVLKGYQLNWKNTDAATIPDTWTLTVEGYTAEGKQIVTVYDSVEQYYPFYSVEDDDIVYHAKFDIAMTVKKVILTFATHRTANPVMSLNQIGFFVCEHYYSIPQNTMYLGLQPTSAICLGKAYYHPETGWEVENLCFGKSCVIPVNNLATTAGLFTEYSVPNPFFSANVSVSVHSYALQPSDTEESYPSASVTSITAEAITISAETAYRYAVAISRNW